LALIAAGNAPSGPSIGDVECPGHL
jgi:hypothetical protein